MWPENRIVTIYINNSYSRYYSAHVRDVAFNLACNVNFSAQPNSPTTFFSTGCFSSTCGSSVVVMLLMLQPRRAPLLGGVSHKGVLVFRQFLDGWRPLWSVLPFTTLVVTQGVLGLISQSRAIFRTHENSSREIRAKFPLSFSATQTPFLYFNELHSVKKKETPTLITWNILLNFDARYSGNIRDVVENLS